MCFLCLYVFSIAALDFFKIMFLGHNFKGFMNYGLCDPHLFIFMIAALDFSNESDFLNESESELWMYIGRIAPNLKNLKRWPCAALDLY